MHVDGKSSSFGGIVAAWAGSITLHAGVILGLHWLTPSLAPVPHDRTVLQVAVIDSVSTSPPEIQSSETAGSALSRAVMKPPVRMTPLTPPVMVSRAQEITTVSATAVEDRPAARLRKQSVLPTHEPQRSVFATRRVESVETNVASRLRPPAPAPQTRRATREGGGVSRTVATAERRGLGGPISSRLPEGESVVTVPFPASVTTRKRPAAGSRHSAETRPGAPPPVIQADTRTTGVRVLEQAPSQVRVAHPAASGSPKLMEDGVAGTRTVQIVQPRAARRVSRTAPELASLRVRQRSTGASIDSISDYGWLAQAVHRRIAELKRYPHAARVNRWEGRVVLRAVIRDDGELGALSVRTSSGHHELDEEAMKLVRQVCPVPLTHPLGRREVTMHIPITYILDR